MGEQILNCVCGEKLQSADGAASLPLTGDDSSNEDQGEGGAEDKEMEEVENKLMEEEKSESGEVDAADPGRTKSSPEEDSSEEEEPEEFSFPDTTISLSHLQPNR